MWFSLSENRGAKCCVSDVFPFTFLTPFFIIVITDSRKYRNLREIDRFLNNSIDTERVGHDIPHLETA